MSYGSPFYYSIFQLPRLLFCRKRHHIVVMAKIFSDYEYRDTDNGEMDDLWQHNLWESLRSSLAGMGLSNAQIKTNEALVWEYLALDHIRSDYHHKNIKWEPKFNDGRGRYMEAWRNTLASRGITFKRFVTGSLYWYIERCLAEEQRKFMVERAFGLVDRQNSSLQKTKRSLPDVGTRPGHPSIHTAGIIECLRPIQRSRSKDSCLQRPPTYKCQPPFLNSRSYTRSSCNQASRDTSRWRGAFCVYVCHAGCFFMRSSTLLRY